MTAPAAVGVMLPREVPPADVSRVARACEDAGFDEVYVANMGPHYRAMIEAYGRDVLPQLSAG